MKLSSAYKVQYDLRPSKQTERRLLLDILRTAGDVGMDLRRYKYLGFGGFKFYDFEMLYRHLGLRDMTSVELDRTLFERCKFNLPFGFIDFQEGLLSDYLDRSKFRKPLVAWLDYDCHMSGDVVGDIRTVSAKAPVGSFVFVTVDARMSEGMRDMPPAERLSSVKEEYRDYALATSIGELEIGRFPLFAEKVLWSSLVDSMSKRTDAKFVPIIRAFYRDTALMVTVGGCLCEFRHVQALTKRLQRDFRFLVPSKRSEPFEFRPFNLSARERHLLDTAVTRKSGAATLRKRLNRLGFTAGEIDDYGRMIRFLPKYVESYI